MTKLEALLSYTHAQRRDTWNTLGDSVIDASARIFFKNSIFQLNVAGAPLTGGIFYVKNDFNAPTSFDWINYTLVSTTDTGEIMDQNSIKHNDLFCILTAAELAAITTPYDPDFVPFANTSGAVIIDDDELENILFEVGVPFITYEELEFTREQILKNAVLPALKEYFKWFPILEIEAKPLSSGGRFEIDIPAHAYTAQRVYLIPGFGLDVNSQNPFYRHWAQSTTGLNVGATFGNPYDRVLRGKKRYMDIQGFNTYVLEKAVRQGAVNYGKRTRISINIQQGKVKGFINQIGVLEIEWAIMSNDWDDVPFNRKQEVKDLATAKILRGLAMLRGQTPKDTPGILDTSSFVARAEALEARTIKLWQDATKAVIVRS